MVDAPSFDDEDPYDFGAKPKLEARLEAFPPEFDDGDLFVPLDPEKPPTRCDNPEAQTARILAQVPNADPVYVRELVALSSPEFIDALLGPMNKRARFVRDALLANGSITAFELNKHYACETKAITDLTQAGIPLLTSQDRIANGRPTTKYALDPVRFHAQRDGREGIPPRVREQILDRANETCSACRGPYPKRVLQVDHRIPFALVGNTLAREEKFAAFQALCPSCNTAKAHACKRCQAQSDTCRSCYWAYPESYKHIATKHERRFTCVASPEKFEALSKLEALARSLGLL